MKDKKKRSVENTQVEPFSTHVRIQLNDKEELTRLKIVAIKNHQTLSKFMGEVVQELLTAYKG